MLKFADIKVYLDNKLLKETFVYGLGNVFMALTPIIVTPFLTRAFSLTQYGAIDLIYTTVLIIATFAGLGLDAALLRFYYDGESGRSLMVTFVFVACAVSSVIFTVLTILFFIIFKGLLFIDPQELHAFFIGLLAIPFIVCLSNQLILLRAQRKAHVFVLISTVNLVLIPVLTIVFQKYLHLGLKSYFVALVTSQLISVLLGAGTLKDSFSFEALPSGFKNKIFVFSLPLLIPMVLGGFLGGVNKYFLQFYHGLSQVAIFSIGLKITMVIGFFGMSFRQAWFSYALSKMDSPDAKEKYKTAFNIFVTVLFAVAFLVIILAKPLILILSGIEYLDARFILAYVCLGTILINLSGSFFNLGLYIKKHTLYSMFAYILGFMVNILTAFMLVPRYSLLGASVSLLLGHITIAALLLYFSNKFYPVRFNLGLLAAYAVLFLIFAQTWGNLIWLR